LRSHTCIGKRNRTNGAPQRSRHRYWCRSQKPHASSVSDLPWAGRWCAAARCQACASGDGYSSHGQRWSVWRPPACKGNRPKMRTAQAYPLISRRPEFLNDAACDG
jgi:hypothetical protein